MPEIKSNINTPEWGKEVRKHAKKLAHTVMMDYVELSKLLYQINESRIDNNPTNPPYFHEWNYKSISEYASEELGISPRKTSYLVGIGAKILVELKHSDPEWVERLLELGWSKVREISRVLKAHQLMDWVLKAEQATFKEIVKMVDAYKEQEDRLKALTEPLTQKYTMSRDPFAPAKPEIPENAPVEGVDVNVAVSGAEFDTPAAIEVPPIPLPQEPVTIANLGVPVPEYEKMHTETFSFYENQHETVQKALKKASELSNSSKKSHNLTLICGSFLTTHAFSKATEEQKLQFIAELEQQLGFKLVAANPEDYSIAYGLENLKKIAAFKINQEQEIEEKVCSR